LNIEPAGSLVADHHWRALMADTVSYSVTLQLRWIEKVSYLYDYLPVVVQCCSDTFPSGEGE